MEKKFSGQLEIYMRQAGLSLRRAARASGIPRQTIHNWMQGAAPRWHPALPGDLRRLGAALHLSEGEVSRLIRLAAGSPARASPLIFEEDKMDGSYRMPKGWGFTGDAPEQYSGGVDPAVLYENRPCVTIQGGPGSDEFAALAQSIKADWYRGKRVRFTAALRSENLTNRAGLFMRVSGAGDKLLAFDNMANGRYISGTNDWGHHAIVLDVAQEAEDIVYGLISSLEGQVWMSDVRLEVVERTVPTTDMLAEIAPFFPENLDFTD